MSEDLKDVKWGIISTAKIAEQELIPALHSSEIAKPYAVASRNEDRAKKYADRNDIPVHYGGYEELLSDPEIEVLYNPLPNSLHREWTIKSAKAGKNILCEKPIGLDAREVREMFDVCDSQDVILMEAFMYRFHPQTKRVKELVDDSAVGKPRLVRAGHSFPLVSMNRPDDFRWKEEMGGGSLMDLGCYCVNTGRYLFGGNPERVYASAVYHPDFTAEAQLQGILEFSDDRLALVDSSFLLQNRAEFEIVGERGKIKVDEAYRSEGRNLEFKVVQGEDRKYESVEGVDEFRLEVDNFSRAVRGMEAPLISEEDSIGNMKTIEALYKSADKEKPVPLD